MTALLGCCCTQQAEERSSARLAAGALHPLEDYPAMVTETAADAERWRLLLTEPVFSAL